MSFIKDLINKFRNKEPEPDEPREIRDRYLESLRRERQFQMMQDEKQYLKQRIADYKKSQMREHLYGIKDKREREKTILDNKRNLMKQNPILNKSKTKRIRIL